MSALKATAASLHEQIRAQLANLRMPGTLEALDEIFRVVERGVLAAPVAIERLLGAQIALRNNRRF